MANSIELYYHPTSFYSQKVRMYLFEKGVSPKLKVVNHHAGEHLSADVLKLNPTGKIPIIRVGNTVISDSDEIYKYGEDNIPGDTLVPSHIADSVWELHDEIHALKMPVLTFGCFLYPKYAKEIRFPKEHIAAVQKRLMKDNMLKAWRLEQRLSSAPKDLVPVISSKIENLKGFLKQIQDRSAVDAALKEVDDVLGKCEEQLERSSGPYLFGKTITIADIDLAVLLLRLYNLGLDKQYFGAENQSRKKVKCFLEKIEDRLSYQLIWEESMKFASNRGSLTLPIVIGAVVVLGLAIGVGLYIRIR